MSWLRELSRNYFRRYHHILTQDQATRWLNFFRMAYFFSAVNLMVYVFYPRKKEITEEDILSGKPVIIDHDEAYRKMREKGTDYGTIYEYKPGEGYIAKEYDRELYYRQLEYEAYERAKRAQEKALKEGRELPKGAIRLVD